MEQDKLRVPEEVVREICADVMVGTYGLTGSLEAARRAVANRINAWLEAALSAESDKRGPTPISGGADERLSG